ncbi:hypothetical protein ME763_32085 [Streptomyces murinus]|uniref:hypothetical protein n=1 Tax=Streptomyces murinus TaxID=33900 RepID=UPI000A1D8798|nr:hypothetical protein [Streptomyces murinus]WDO09930.1 hypothetical protein ME763_32085 [Streptomyces murinus]
MAIGYAHTLYCDRRGCRGKVTIPDTRHAADARGLARAQHSWECDADGDFCPADKTARATETRGPSQ